MYMLLLLLILSHACTCDKALNILTIDLNNYNKSYLPYLL